MSHIKINTITMLKKRTLPILWLVEVLTILSLVLVGQANALNTLTVEYNKAYTLNGTGLITSEAQNVVRESESKKAIHEIKNPPRDTRPKGWNQLKTTSLEVQDQAGWCLRFAQYVFFGQDVAPDILYPTAWIGWENAQYKHADYNLPQNVVVPIWFDFAADLGEGYQQYGHAAVYYNGQVYTAPWSGYGAEWWGSIDEFAAARGLIYAGWSEDIAGERVLEYVA